MTVTRREDDEELARVEVTLSIRDVAGGVVCGLSGERRAASADEALDAPPVVRQRRQGEHGVRGKLEPAASDDSNTPPATPPHRPNLPAQDEDQLQGLARLRRFT